MNNIEMLRKINKSESDIVELNEQLDNKMNKNKIVFPNNTVHIAHRGYSALYPENTVLAFEQAVKEGFFGIENDVFLTLDNEFVCMHDKTVDRTTNGTGTVSSLTLAQIQNLTIDGGKFIELHNNLKVATLEEYFKVCRSGAVGVCEMKATLNEETARKYIDLVKSVGVEDKVITCSYDIQNIRLLHSIDNNLNYGVIVDTPTFEYLESIKDLNIFSLSTLKTTMSNDYLIAEIKSRGYKLLVYTAYQTDVGQYDYYKADGIITDYKLF